MKPKPQFSPSKGEEFPLLLLKKGLGDEASNFLQINIFTMQNFFRFLILISILLAITLNLPAQKVENILERKITLDISELTIQETLKNITEKTGIGFSYSNDLVSFTKKVTIKVIDNPLKDVFDQLVANTFITYTIVGNQVVFQSRKKTSNKHTISGYISDKETGEKLIGVIIQEDTTKAATTSNNYGFYSITLPEGEYKLKYLYLGYNMESREIGLAENSEINIQLTPSLVELKEITITDKAYLKHVESTQMGISELQMKNIKSFPVLIGEKDIMKTLQLLPGIQQGTEGSSSLYVRGGSSDQNLILLDGAPVYNVNHLFGFMSTFNDDAIQSVSVLKGGIPARYGGRLSSVVDVNMKEGSNKKFEAQFAIGTLASRLTLEGPIFSENTSFIFSARRTYSDLLYRPLMQLYTAVNPNESIDEYYYFQDYNLKLNHAFSSKSHLYFSVYSGDDEIVANHNYNLNVNMLSEKYSFNWGNVTATSRWNYKMNDKLFSNITLIYSQYKLKINGISSIRDSTLITQNGYGNDASGIQDYGIKIDFDYYLNTNHTLHFGSQGTLHSFNPGKLSEGSSIENVANSRIDTSLNLSNIHLIENDFYIEDEIKISDRLKTNIGLRYGIANVQNKSYQSLQPRISLRYLILDNWSAKAAWSRMNQNLNLLTSPSSINFPLDLWIPATSTLKPQRSDIFSIGTLYGFENNIEISTELYYKTMNNVIDYKDGTSFVFADTEWDKKIVQGKGLAYGAEFLIEKKTGSTFGWLSYTLSKSMRQFNEINSGNWFPYQYDRRHNLNLVVGHRFSENFEIGGTWVLSSGNLYTLNNEKYPSYLEPGRNVESFDSRNNFQGPLYHRLDLSMSFTKQKKWGFSTWSFGCYNVYNHKNPTAIYVDVDNKVHQWASMPIIPSVTYTFRFKKDANFKKNKKEISYDKASSPEMSAKHDSVPKSSNLALTEKGNRMFGMAFNAGYSTNAIHSSSQILTSVSVFTSWTLAKFRAHNYLLGSQMNISYLRNQYFTDTTYKKIAYNNSYSFTYGILNRYYFGNWKTKPFVQMVPLYTLPSYIGASFGVGITHFASDRVAFEAVLSDYEYLNSKNRNVNFKIGIQFYLP
jgi:hypothetical protein